MRILLLLPILGPMAGVSWLVIRILLIRGL
jgi:hypothetical protein